MIDLDLVIHNSTTVLLCSTAVLLCVVACFIWTFKQETAAAFKVQLSLSAPVARQGKAKMCSGRRHVP